LFPLFFQQSRTRCQRYYCLRQHQANFLKYRSYIPCGRVIHQPPHPPFQNNRTTLIPHQLS
jgi:hypothetical protein